MTYRPDLEDYGYYAGRRHTRGFNTEFPPVSLDPYTPLKQLLDSSEQPPACKVDPDPDRWIETHALKGEDLQYMKRLCLDCPVRKACLDYALAHDVVGVWAGTTRPERERTRKALGQVAERLPSGYLPAGQVKHTTRSTW